MALSPTLKIVFLEGEIEGRARSGQKNSSLHVVGGLVEEFLFHFLPFYARTIPRDLRAPSLSINFLQSKSIFKVMIGENICKTLKTRFTTFHAWTSAI